MCKDLNKRARYTSTTCISRSPFYFVPHMLEQKVDRSQSITLGTELHQLFSVVSFTQAFSQLITGGTRFWNYKISQKYANLFFKIKHHIKMYSAGLWTCKHQAVISWAKFPLSYAKVRRQRPLKGNKQVNHIIAPPQIPPPPPPHPPEEFDLTRWDGEHCVTPARGTAKQSTIWFNAYVWTNLFSA